LDPNTIFPDLSENNFQTVKDELKQRFTLVSNDIQKGTKEAFVIDTTEGKINFTFYSNGKLVVQSSPANTVYTSIVDEISNSISIQPTKKIEVIPKEESELISDYYIGCDEAGAGESFGSMFLGCAIISKENLEAICDIIKGKNIRQLTKHEVNQTYNAISSLFDSVIRTYQAAEIDAGSKNVLLDRGYIELISKITEGKSKFSIVIDDYGTRHEMNKFASSLKTQDVEVIIKNKADEQYTACKIASLIARKARIEEVDYIDNTNSLVDQTTKDLISPSTGAASNPNTARYLIEYRKKFPTAEFPPFVRKKWKNVMEIEAKCPRQREGLFVKCTHCNTELSRVDIQWDIQHGTKFYCSNCANLITVSDFRGSFQKNLITLDTSTLISRIASKDLTTSKYLEGNTFLLPSFVYEELDKKQPDKKKGAQKEVSELGKFKKQQIIGFENVDTHTLAHGVSNDKKLLAVLNNRNATLLTKDRIMATFAEVDHFVLFVKGL